ncbi:hypothetical protein L7F22_068404 [Adiantum nelumboides]|nr:hypothetical protein [Adiantum nelumboides]
MASGSRSAGRYIVVALDFGTTYSGFAYRQKSDSQERVRKFYEWKDRGGRREYCKTITALYYESTDSAGHTYELKDWGWSALQICTAAMESAYGGRRGSTSVQGQVNAPGVPELCRNGVTCFNILPGDGDGTTPRRSACYVEQFKLDLLREPLDRMKLPGDLNTERLIVDYLRCLGEHAMAELRTRFSNSLGKDAVEWCLTVPAIWKERPKQVMRVCAERAGLVQGAECPTPSAASPYALDIILEPEGASMYCHEQRKDELNVRRGDRLLVADIGGGTIDLVVHEKTEDDDKGSKVQEVVPSYGKAGGGTFVDKAFFKILGEKISCLDAHCRQDPSVRLAIDKQWQLIKTTFQGENTDCALLSLPAGLRKAWRKHDREHRPRQRVCEDDDDDDDYSQIMLEADDFRRIFDPEVEKVIDLIRQQVKGVRVLMLVGGLASSEYLKRRVIAEFQGGVSQIVVPLEPGSAICHGAVLLHLLPQSIESRVQPRTYGLLTSRKAVKWSDPKEYIFKDDDGKKLCKNAFDVFVKMGERVERNQCITRVYNPTQHGATRIQLSLYSCATGGSGRVPKFVTDEGCTLEGSFDLDIEAGMKLGKKREVEVTMVFGASIITLSAAGKNFGDGATRVERSFPVTFV